MDNKATTNPLFTFHSKSLVRFFSSMLRYSKKKNYFSRASCWRSGCGSGFWSLHSFKSLHFDTFLDWTWLFFSTIVLTFSFSFFQILHFKYPWWWWWRRCYILSKTFSVYFETEWFMRSGLNGAIVKISVSNVKTSYNPNIMFQFCCAFIIQKNCPFLWRLLFDMNARILSPYLPKPPITSSGR